MAKREQKEGKEREESGGTLWFYLQVKSPSETKMQRGGRKGQRRRGRKEVNRTRAIGNGSSQIFSRTHEEEEGGKIEKTGWKELLLRVIGQA
jgi:hypothetical protein